MEPLRTRRHVRGCDRSDWLNFEIRLNEVQVFLTNLDPLVRHTRGGNRGRERRNRKGRSMNLNYKEEKMSNRERERDRDLELLIPVAGTSENGGSKSSSPSVSPPTATPHHSSREVCFSLSLFKSCLRLSPQFRILANSITFFFPFCDFI